MHLEESKFRMFSETSVGTVLHDEEDDIEIFFKPGPEKGTVWFTMHPLVPGYLADRVDRLPPACSAKVNWTPPRIFDYFAATMSEQYAFFKERGADWPAIVRSHRKRVTPESTDEQLFSVFESMLGHIDDPHTRVVAEIDGEERLARGSKNRTNPAVKEQFDEQHKIKDFDQYRSSIMQAVRAGVTDQILRGASTETANRLIWGRVTDDIGYILIGGMGNFSDDETDIEGELKALHNGLDEILTALADTKGIILDLSFNGGGMDLYSLAIAGHFTDKRRLAFTKGPFNAKDVLHKVYVEPYGGAEGKKPVRYTKPIYAVCSDFTVSAAEIFLLCMRSLPNARIAGMKTEGALSDVLEKPLPNGWMLGLSNEIYRDHKGSCFEEVGLPVDIELKLFDVKKPGLAHVEGIQSLVEKIK